MIAVSALQFRNLSIDNLFIASGRTSVIGPNGSGKTTLLRLLSGIDVPAKGSVSIDNLPPRTLDIGWVGEYPDKNLLFTSVFNEIASPLSFRKIPCKQTDARVTEISEMMGIENLLNREVRGLSGGERIIVAAAAALVHRPAVLILDEYDSHLDTARCRDIEAAICVARPRYIIRCTQQMETAAVSDQVVFLQHGRVLHTGAPAEVFRLLEQTPYYPRSWRVES